MKNRAKIGSESDSERKRQEKTTKTASGAISGRTFASPGSFSVDFGVPAGRQNWQKTAPEQHDSYFFTALFRFFGVLFARVCSGSVPDRFWRLRGPSRTRFCNDFARFFCRFRRDLVVVCRVPPECCRDTPPASGTHSAGFLWGTAISRSELNKETINII